MPLNHNNLYLATFLEHDQSVMEREAAWAMDEPEVENVVLYSQSCTKAFYGDLKKARELSRFASNSAIRAGQKKLPQVTVRMRPFGRRYLAMCLMPSEGVRTALETSSGQDVQAAAALAYAFAGDQSRARWSRR